MTRSPDLPPVQRQSRHQSARHSGCVAAVGVCVGRPLPDRGPGRAGRPVPPPAFVTDPSAECRLRLRRRRRSVSCAGRIRGGPRRIAYELAQRVGGPGGRDTNRDPTMPGGSSSGVAPVPCTRKPCRRWLSRRSGRPRGRTASTGRPGRCARVDRLLAPTRWSPPTARVCSCCTTCLPTSCRGGRRAAPGGRSGGGTVTTARRAFSRARCCSPASNEAQRRR